MRVEDLIGDDVVVMYHPDAEGWADNPDPFNTPYQVEGALLGVTDGAIEGEFLVIHEVGDVGDDEEGPAWEAGYRCIPTHMVVAVVVAEDGP